MMLCPHCEHENLEGTLFCEKCGKSLFVNQSSNSISTHQLRHPTDDLGVKATWGTARFDQQATIVMHIQDTATPIAIHPTDEAILGRADAASGTNPHVDLSPYGALDMGVSRLHAAIRRGDDTLTLIDLGSVNGTHLNGQRLIPNQPRVLRDGDEIRLGDLVLHIYFK